MNAWRMAVVLCVIALAGAGCIQNQKLLKLNKDGSGTLVEEVYMSPQLTGMMEQMTAGMSQAMEQGGAKVDPNEKSKAKAALEPLALFKGDIEKRTAELGSGVKLVSTQAKTNDKGWKGYVATFSFPDVSKLNLSMEAQSDDDGGMGATKKKKETLYLEFRKTPLPAIMFREKKTDKLAKPEKKAAAAESMPGVDAMPAGMLSSMLQGMRVSFIVEVDGKITRSNSHYRQGDNRVVLMDMQMDKVLANAAGAKLIEGGKDDPEALNKLRALNIPGLVLEDMGRGIAIEWQ